MSNKSVSWLAAAIILTAMTAAAQNPPANAINCGTGIDNQPLVKIPEIQSLNGALKGTLYTVSEQVKMTVKGVGTTPFCVPQWVRAYRPNPPASWNPSSQQLSMPMPGPTLRARVGEMVNLTFLNAIDASKFPGVDDDQCDQTNVYPGTGPGIDKYPDCFAGSVYTNVHYHGTHTNPNTTGDNVFLQIRPSPRKTDGTNAPEITAQSVQPAFDEFFAQCRQQLLNNPGPKIWPRRWPDIPSALQTALMAPLKQYAPAVWAENEKLIAQGNWPQYYLGAYPYCFKIPQYTDTTATSTASPDVRTPHTHGAGQAEIDEQQAPNRPLIMGQAPGTHWYHAHKHGSTTINVSNGMTGAFVIEGPYDDDINAYYGANWTRGDQQKVLVVQQLGGPPGLMTGAGGGPGPDFSVNGRLRPTISMAGGSVQMWRIANTAGRAGMFFPAPTALQWRQLAQDGVQFNDANYKASTNTELLLASGNRADLLVKAPKYVKGGQNTYPVLVYNTVDASDRPPARAASPVTLLTVVVTPDGTEMQFMPNAPSFPPFLSDITDAEITGTKVLTFASTLLGLKAPPPPSQHTIDGKLFNGELGAVVALNRAEEWKVVNQTFPPSNLNQVSHPFHIHINPFQITEVFDPNAVQSSKALTGKVTVAISTAGNTGTVTGTEGTSFKTDFRPGDWIWFTSNFNPGIVLSVESDSSMTINVAKALTTASGYSVAVPLYTIDKATARPEQCVLDPNDPSTWKPCTPTEPATNRIWWDVFSIPSGNTFVSTTGQQFNIPGYFKMRSRFVDFPGYFVLHCHILAHEDRGMMTVVEVAPLQTPYSHH